MSTDIAKMEIGTVFEMGELMPEMSDEVIVWKVLRRKNSVTILEAHWLGMMLGIFSWDGKGMYRDSFQS